MNVFSYKLRKLLSDKNELTALPTASETHADASALLRRQSSRTRAASRHFRYTNPLPTIMKNIFATLILLIIGQSIFGQNYPISYVNYKEIKETQFDWDYRISEITLTNENEFEFWSRPDISCFTWREYNGTWERKSDTIVFTDKYLLENPDIEFTSHTDQKIKSYIFNYKYDNNQKIEGREIEIIFVYDFDSKLKDVTKTYKIGTDYSIDIPFEEIESREELSSFKIVLNPNTSWKIWNYFTINEFVNKKGKDLPNIIDITFISKPKKEIISRITKAILIDEKIKIISKEKNKSDIPDYTEEIEFKEIYKKQNSK
jgi:hypothetical protein